MTRKIFKTNKNKYFIQTSNWQHNVQNNCWEIKGIEHYIIDNLNEIYRWQAIIRVHEASWPHNGKKVYPGEYDNPEILYWDKWEILYNKMLPKWKMVEIISKENNCKELFLES